MRIAIDTLFENPDNPTGAVDYLRNVARVFPRLGVEHDFYFLVSDRNLRHFLEYEAENLHFIQCFRSNENMPVRILLQQSLVPVLLKKHKIDTLFAPGNVCPFWGNYCRVLKINTLHHYHAPELVGRMRTLYRKLFFQESARRADHILANTNDTKAQICDRMGIPAKKITVIAEALYDIYAPTAPETGVHIRNKYGLDPNYILFVSMLYPYKNPETLMKAFACLVGRGGLDLKLAIVGGDFDGQQVKLESLAGGLGISDRVRFLGFVPAEDLPALYSNTKVFVFPSLIETFGKPLVEAMRCGAPVVASNISCIPEVLGGAGLLVNPLDTAEMAGAIKKLIDDQKLREDLIQKGLKRAADFSWERGARETLNVIEQSHERWK